MRRGAKGQGDLSPTAMYTAATWHWGGLAGAELLMSDEFRAVFRVVNFFYAIRRLFDRRVEPMREALLHRHAMIDHLLARAGSTQVLELAAGFSRRGAAYSADPKLVYVELDLPHVVAKKRALLERSDAGRAVLARANLRLVAGDAASLPLEELVAPGAPLFAISEGLLVYLTALQQRALFARVAAALRHAGGGAYAFDLVPWVERPKDRFGGVLHRWMKRFTKGQGFEPDERSRDDVIAELVAAGFARAEAIDARDVARAWALPFPDVATQQVVFVATVDASESSAWRAPSDWRA